MNRRERRAEGQRGPVPKNPAELAAIVAAGALAAAETGERVGEVNQYECQDPECTRVVTTVNRAAGVTPMFITCAKCRGPMQSKWYDVDQALAPTHEWYRPTPDELAGKSLAQIDHVRDGGLLLREVMP